MQNIFRLFWLFLILCLLGLLGAYLHHIKSSYEQNIKAHFEKSSALIDRALLNEQLSALAIATIASQNSAILRCFKALDHNICMDASKELVATLTQVPNYKNAAIHLHDSAQNSLARSWDNGRYGDNLLSFRYLLTRLASTLAPQSGIEVGRCGIFIRGISPLFLDKKLAGSVEVLLDFTQAKTVAKAQGLELMMLLDARFKSDCVDMGQNRIKEHFILNPTITNLNLLPLLEAFDYQNDSFAKFGEVYLFSKPIFDAKNQRVGFMILSFDEALDGLLLGETVN